MPLDRQIIVKVTAAGTRNMHDEYVPGLVVTRQVWATRQDISYDDTPTQAGVRNEIRRRYRVRWIHEFASASLNQVTVTDGTLNTAILPVGLLTLNCDGISEVTGKFGEQRRRYLDIDLVWSL